jgi:hypothetical protein
VENPALAPDKELAFALTAGLVTREGGDFLAPLGAVAGNDPLKLASGGQAFTDVVAALRTLADPGNGILGNGNVSLAAAHKGWELSFTDRAYSGVFVRADLVHTAVGANPATSIAFNTSALVSNGLELKDLALAKSFAWSFPAGQIRVGAAVHALWGTTYVTEESAFTADAGASPWHFAQSSLTGLARSHTDWSVDAGALFSLGPVRLGGVWRGINKPSFPYAEGAPAAERGQSVTYGSQARVGASVHVPLIGLTFAADYDLTANDTLVPGLRSREVGGGVEWTIIAIVVRGGASINLESPDRKPALTGGAGVVIGPAKVDVGGWYRTSNGALGLVATARFGI